MPFLSDIFSFVSAYIRDDPGSSLFLFIIASVAIGALTSIPNFSFLSGRNSPDENAAGLVFGKITGIPTVDDDVFSSTNEDRNQKKKHLHRRQSETNGLSMDKRKQGGQKENKTTQRTLSISMQSKASILEVLISGIRLCFAILLPFIIFSIIPSLYPIYKSLIAPHLPVVVQQFFTDLKSLFLAFCSIYLSGAAFDSTLTPSNLSSIIAAENAQNSFQFSLQDWIYSYIQRCDIYSNVYSVQVFCNTCKTPTWIEKWKSGNYQTCSVCDLCPNNSDSDSPQLSMHLVDENCSILMNDIIKIMKVGNDKHEIDFKFATILKDCISTFWLYMRFSFHVIYRVILRGSRDFFIFLRYCSVFLKWIFNEIQVSYFSNRLHAIAMIFILIVTSLIIISLIQYIIYILRSILSVYYSFVTSPKSTKEKTKKEIADKPIATTPTFPLTPQESIASRIHNFHNSYITAHTIEPTIPMPTWLANDNYRGSHQGQLNIEDVWATLTLENPEIAEIIASTYLSGEELEWLSRLTEQLVKDSQISAKSYECLHTIITLHQITSPTYSQQNHFTLSSQQTFPFSPMVEQSSPLQLSPMRSFNYDSGIRKSYTGSDNYNGFNRMNQRMLFRKQSSLKGKTAIRNSVSSDFSGWSGLNRTEATSFEEGISDLL